MHRRRPSRPTSGRPYRWLPSYEDETCPDGCRYDSPNFLAFSLSQPHVPIP